MANHFFPHCESVLNHLPTKKYVPIYAQNFGKQPKKTLLTYDDEFRAQ